MERFKACQFQSHTAEHCSDLVQHQSLMAQAVLALHHVSMIRLQHTHVLLIAQRLTLFACCSFACYAMQNGRVAATPRQLEAMIRISEALARMHLRTEVGARPGCGLHDRDRRSCATAPMHHNDSLLWLVCAGVNIALLQGYMHLSAVVWLRITGAPNAAVSWCGCLQVTEDDVRSAYRLWFDALSGSAADEEGQLDMNVLTGGTSAKHAQYIANELPHLLRGILTGKDVMTALKCLRVAQHVGATVGSLLLGGLRGLPIRPGCRCRCWV